MGLGRQLRGLDCRSCLRQEMQELGSAEGSLRSGGHVESPVLRGAGDTGVVGEELLG